MLNIDLEYRKGVLFLRLSGILNRRTSFILDDALDNIVNRVGIRFLLINFEKLQCIDKYGINTIMNSYNRYFKKNGKLMICGFNNKIISNFKRSNILSCVNVVKNELSAFNIVSI